MKTEFASKDSFTGIVLATILIAIASSIVTSGKAHASQPSAKPMQKMETIVVTGSRHADAVLDTVVVTASRLKKSQV